MERDTFSNSIRVAIYEFIILPFYPRFLGTTPAYSLLCVPLFLNTFPFYIEATERSPMDGVANGFLGFPRSVYCCIPHQLLSAICQPTQSSSS
jgi:hypothetical protein